MDTEMRTSVADVYAAGDVCTVEWDPQSKLWFQVCACACVCSCIYVPSSSVRIYSLLFTDEAVDSGQTDGSICCQVYGSPPR